jgi:hypothetical protein
VEDIQGKDKSVDDKVDESVDKSFDDKVDESVDKSFDDKVGADCRSCLGDLSGAFTRNHIALISALKRSGFVSLVERRQVKEKIAWEEILSHLHENGFYLVLTKNVMMEKNKGNKENPLRGYWKFVFLHHDRKTIFVEMTKNLLPCDLFFYLLWLWL